MIPKIKQEVDFEINKQDRSVTATLLVSYFMDDRLYVLREVTGTAKCHPEDEWDEEIGKRIAESRAIQKAMKILKRYTKYKLDRLNTEQEILKGLFNKVDLILSKEVDHELLIERGIQTKSQC